MNGIKTGYVLLFGVVVALLSSIFTGIIIERGIERGPVYSPVPSEIVIINGTGSQEAIVSTVFNQVKDSVVHITSRTRERDAFMRLTPVEGVGTGVIISAEGYILTNNHVIGDSDELRVTLSSGEDLEASIVGVDVNTDLGIIKIEPPKTLTVAKLGDSDKIKPGQMAIAIGNPYRLDHTVTVGVISAVNRTLTVEGNYRIKGVIQTDAAINPGNSGGPLLNSKGEVIGINSAIITTTRGFQGIGFSIPINIAKKISGELIEKGKVVRPWLGLTGMDLTEDIAESLDIDITKGVILVDVLEGGPVDKAGLVGIESQFLRSDFVLGDIIIEIGGEKTDSIDDLIDIKLKHEVGETVEIKYIRKGEERTVRVTLGENPEG
ncbi:MAG: trypsin-like peptidase domain-containing protein [Candidatus Hydrothermarchaeaceae archaeon]